MMQNMLYNPGMQQMQQHRMPQLTTAPQMPQQGGNASLQVITQGPGGQMYTDSSMQTPYNPPGNNMPQMPLQNRGITSIQQPPQDRRAMPPMQPIYQPPVNKGPGSFGNQLRPINAMPIQQPPKQVGGPVQPPFMRPQPIQPPQYGGGRPPPLFRPRPPQFGGGFMPQPPMFRRQLRWRWWIWKTSYVRRRWRFWWRFY